MNRYSEYLPALEEALKELDEWRSSFGKSAGQIPFDPDKLQSILQEYTGRLKGNYPFHHPVYAGQMLKPPHPVAWIAYSLAMTINPNNHALDGGPPSSAMEQDVMKQLAAMAGYDSPWLGHLTSGGTVANLEALWIARELHPEKAIASTSAAHYTHERMCRVLNTCHLEVPADADGVPDFTFLDDHAGEIGTLVVTMGTTGTGDVEPLEKLHPWAREHGVRIHLDAAYGGFYQILAENGDLDSKRWATVSQADSIVIDPHKHGLQPYGSGSVLFRDPSVGRFYKHDSPYTYFTSDELHLGEITLECSRAGASAAALWLTLRLLPLNMSGLGGLLLDCRNAAIDLSERILTSGRYQLYKKPQLDIVTFFPIPAHSSTSAVSEFSRKIFQAGMKSPEHRLFLSLCKVPARHFTSLHPKFKADTDQVTLLRSVLMKPEHREFAGELMERLEKLAE